jgi:hypothetical protein
MPVTFRAPEPVRFDVDPPEDWEPSLRSQEEVDALFWDQLLNKGKRGVNWLADQLLGRTAEEEFETAMVEFANPLISLVPRKTQKQLIDLFRSRAGSEPSAEASRFTMPARGSRPERIYRREDDEIIPVPDDTALHKAARWVSERYPRTMSHVEDAIVDPRLAGYAKHGGEVAGQIGERGRFGAIPFMIRDNLRNQYLNYGRGVSPAGHIETLPAGLSRGAPFHIGINPMFAGRSARLDPDNPLLTETAEAIDVLTHELTHGGQMLRHGSRQQDVLARDDWAKDYVPFKAVPEGTSYWRSPAERRAHTAGLANQLHYLMDERRWADSGVVSGVDEAIALVIDKRMGVFGTPQMTHGAEAVKALTAAAAESPAALRREIQRIASEVTDDKLNRAYRSEQSKWDERNVGDVFEP